MRVLITGIAGFAGSHLAELLLEEGAEVHGSLFPEEPTRNVEPFRPHLRLSICDVRDAEAVRELVAEAKPDEIYHLAAVTFIPESIDDPRLTYDTNLFGTMNVLEATKKLTGAPSVLFVGSADVYGTIRKEENPVDEGAPLRPANPYSVSKVSADMLAYQYGLSNDMHIIRVRPFNHTGPRQSPRFVCSDFARQVVEVEKGRHASEISVGNLKPRRDFTDVRDVVRAYRDVLRGGEPGEAYNVCSGSSESVGEILYMLMSISGLQLNIVESPDRLRKTDVEEAIGDYGKIEKAVGWRPSIPIMKTLEDTIDYWRGIS